MGIMRTKQLLYTLRIEYNHAEGTYYWIVHFHNIAQNYFRCCYLSTVMTMKNGEYYVGLATLDDARPVSRDKFLKLSKDYDVQRPFPFIQRKACLL